MAQVVKLKRTAVSGKIPSISNLELGELAINTYDGRIFFEKDSGTATISEILTTNTENYITGSLKLNGAVTASYFVGDGSQLTNVSATISENATVTGSFSNASSFTVNHAFETKNIIVSVYDNNDSQIIPQSITLTDNNNVRITLSSAQSGFAVVAKGGHIVSGSAGDASNLNGQPASYYLDYSNLNNIPSGIISSSAQIDNLFDIDGLVSSSNQVTELLPSGVVSGSDQVASTFAQTILDDTSAGAVRTTIGVDAAGTDNSTDVTLAGSYDYLSLSGQQITLGQVDASTDISNLTTSNVTEGTNQYYTDTRVKTKLNAEGVLSGSSHSGNQTFDDNVVITGNLTVNGTTTSVNSNTVNIGDNIIVLNSDESGTPSQDAGIEVERGTSTNVRFHFKESTDRWQFSNDGSTYFNLPTSTADVAEFSNLYYTDARVKTKLNAEGVLSGSAQITDLTTHKETVSGASSYAVTHNLNESYPIVQAWNTGTSQQELPTSVTTNSVNQVTVVFSTTFAGVIIVKK